MINVICLTCKKRFKTFPSRIKAGKGKYCSHKCSAMATKNGFQKEHPDFVSKKSRKQAGLIIKHLYKIGKMISPNKGKRSYNWKGGKMKSNGYWWIFKPEHPRANKNGYIKQSILVAEKCLKRYLTKEEIVHHIRNKDDDRPKMLYLFSNIKGHTRYHISKDKSILKSNLLSTL